MTKKKFLLITVILLVGVGILLGGYFLTNPRVHTFSFLASENEGLSQDIAAAVSGDSITVTVPADFKGTSLRPHIDFTGEAVFIGADDYMEENTRIWLHKPKTVTARGYTGRFTEYSLFFIREEEGACRLGDVRLSSAKNAGLGSNILLEEDENGSTMKAMVPSTMDLSKAVLSFAAPDGATVTANGKRQRSGSTKNDFTKPVVYTVENGGQKKTYAISLEPLEDTVLPNVYIYFENYDNDARPLGKSILVDASFTMLRGREGEAISEYYAMPIGMKLRGNSSLEFPKKNYKLQFEQKVSIMGMPESKDWLLLSNYCDKSLLRNMVGLELGSRLDHMDFTPEFQYCNLFLNGKYWGNYIIGEQIKVEENRVNVQTQEAGNTNLTGGYLFQVNQRNDGEVMIYPKGYSMEINYPKEDVVTEEQKEYLTEYLEEFIRRTEAGESYDNLIDVDSFVDWYLCNEIMKTLDASGYASIFLYKDADGPLKMGPVWDFDISSGNTNYQDPSPSKFWIRDSTWFGDMFHENDSFMNLVKARWQELYAAELATLPDYIAETARYIDASQRDNFKKWEILNEDIWPNYDVFGSYEKEVEYLTSWMQKRLEFLNSRFGK